MTRTRNANDTSGREQPRRARLALPTDAPAWPQAWTGGLSVEFVRTYSCHILDEDWRDDADEIFAKITFNDFRVGRTQTANSNKIVQDFSTAR